MSQVKGLEERTRNRSLFDPQYYLPNSPKARLATYAFFPDQISDGFSTGEFPLVAMDSAKQCVQFQISQNFEGIIIPARFIDQMTTNYFEVQEEYTVVPFLKAIADTGTSKPVYLTIPITTPMLRDEGFQLKLLNWITGYPKIAGVYVLVSDDRKTKQICSADMLFAYFQFAHELSATGLKVILGHLNTESVLFTLIPDVTVTFGSFENTRMFSLDKFIDNDEERRPPKARIYIPALLNWIQYGHAMQIRSDAPELWSQIYAPTIYSERVIEAKAEPYFSQPDLYKHHFLCMRDHIKQLDALPLGQRFDSLRRMIRSAVSFHDRISDMPLDLDQHGNGAHLNAWLDSVNRYYRKYLKS